MIINEAYKTLFQTTKKYIVLKGGAGAGKSRAISQFLVYCLTSRKNFKVLAMCKTYATIRDTVYTELKTVIQNESLESDFSFTQSPFRITHIATGNEVIFRGMDDENKLKSISGINIIWLEEADNFELDDFSQASIRLRGTSEYPYQVIISFNPTSELSWLKATFFDDGNPYENDSLILETTYRDNNFLQADYKKALEALGHSSPEKQRVYLNGEWGRVSTDGLFYKHFDSLKHVRENVNYNPELPLWLSWDFNVVPSCTCLVFQIQDDKTIWQLDEFQAKSPHNNTAAIAQRFKSRYGFHRNRLYITGDPAGRQRDTRGEEGRNDYTIILNELQEMNPILRVPTVAPNQLMRGDFINAIFYNNWEGLKIEVADGCKKTIIDLTYQKETATGKDKKKVKDKETGATYEQYGHCSDAFDYQIVTVWTTEYERFKDGPKRFNYQFGKNKISSKYL